MDEFERLQAELQNLYVDYLGRFRNLEFLEHELEVHYRTEQDKAEESDRRLKKLQKRMACVPLCSFVTTMAKLVDPTCTAARS
jgi:hypothetical protein